MLESKKTSFEYGYRIMGTRTSNVGEDLIGIFKSPESWTTEYSGTGVDFDPANPEQIKKTADGARPEAMLFDRVSDELSDIEMYENIVSRDEVPAGLPVAIVPFKSGAIIRTELLAEGYEPALGDELYIADSRFQKTDPTGDSSGVVVAKVISILKDGKVRLLLK